MRNLFATDLENFDVIGGWRTKDEGGRPVDAAGTTLGGAKIEGLAGLRALLLEQPDQFPRTVTEKLMPTRSAGGWSITTSRRVRKIVRDAAPNQYRWTSLIQGIVESPEFLMRAPAMIN